MDFNSLLHIAQKNDHINKQSEGGFRTELSAPKREKTNKPRSEVVHRLIDEKRKEKELGEKQKKENEHRHSGQDKEEEKSKGFKIPRKKDTIQNILKDLDSDSEGSSPSEGRSLREVEKKSTSMTAVSKEHHNHTGNLEHGHKNHKSFKHKDEPREHKSEKEKHQSREGSSDSISRSDKHGSHDRHKSSHSSHHSSSSSDKKHHGDGSHSQAHSSSKHGSSSGKDSKDRDSSSKHNSNSGRDSKDRDKHTSAPAGTSSSSSQKHSSSSSSKDKDRSSSSSSHKKQTDSSSTKSVKDLSLDELRKQVQEMKEFEARVKHEEELEKKTQEKAVTHTIEFQKNRQGVELDEVEAKKAKILSRTQMILERTKAKLAEQKMGKSQQRQRGKRTSDKESKTSKEGDKVKSRSIIKGDDSDDDDEPVNAMDLSSNQELMMTESGDILKNIKKKIDEKLGNYNFPDRPSKEKQTRKKLSSGGKELKKSRDKNSSHKHEKHRDKHKHKSFDKERDKREKIKEMMRKDYNSSFSEGSTEQKPKVKKPVIVKRFQQQPPPLNFNDLLKIAEEKSKEKVPEPVVKKVPKKTDERLLTQEEIDRRKRAEEVKKRRAEEEKMYQEQNEKGIKNSASNESAIKHKSDSSLLKNALTGSSGRASPGLKNASTGSTSKASPGLKNAVTGSPGKASPGLKSSQNGAKQMNPKSKTEGNNNVLVCGPAASSSKVKPQPQIEAQNPWDRIYGQIQKNNPKKEAKKRPAVESDYDEEEDEYDEDDDFIDDDDGGEDVSAHIRSIFGYDKRKYLFEDDDIDNMEANFTTIMKEEARSAKIGKMEDLEDMRREEEELKAKARKKMRR